MKELPSEIIQQVLHEFAIQLDTEIRKEITFRPYLRKSSYTELIKLRLVSKTFSRTVLSLYFETMSIGSSKRADIILRNWNDGLGCVRRLRIEKLWYDEDKDCSGGKSTVVSMVQLVKLIKLLGKKLHTLDITFCSCMGLTDCQEVVESLQELKSLRLSHSYSHMELGTYEPYSLLESATHLPKLECLSLDCDDLLEHCGDYWGPGDFSSISHLSLAPDDEEEANCHIIRLVKKTLKVVELPYTPDACEAIQEILQPVKDTLEGFFTTTVSRNLIEGVANWNFLTLRVVGFHSSSYPYYENDMGSNGSWLQVPMMRNVRTIVTDSSSAENWNIKMNGLRKGPNLKHVIFNKQNFHEDNISPELIEDLNSQIVQCHVIHGATAQEIMELDYRLNGPITF